MRQVVHEAFGYENNGHHTNEPDPESCSKAGPDVETQAFIDLLHDVDQPLWEGCELSKLSFLVLFHVKSSSKWSNKSLNDLLQILQLALANSANIPRTFVEAREIIAKLGLRYEKIMYAQIIVSSIERTRKVTTSVQNVKLQGGKIYQTKQP